QDLVDSDSADGNAIGHRCSPLVRGSFSGPTLIGHCDGYIWLFRSVERSRFRVGFHAWHGMTRRLRPVSTSSRGTAPSTTSSYSRTTTPNWISTRHSWEPCAIAGRE